jgi:hypothetical protein
MTTPIKDTTYYYLKTHKERMLFDLNHSKAIYLQCKNKKHKQNECMEKYMESMANVISHHSSTSAMYPYYFDNYHTINDTE